MVRTLPLLSVYGVLVPPPEIDTCEPCVKVPP